MPFLEENERLSFMLRRAHNLVHLGDDPYFAGCDHSAYSAAALRGKGHYLSPYKVESDKDREKHTWRFPLRFCVRISAYFVGADSIGRPPITVARCVMYANHSLLNNGVLRVELRYDISLAFEDGGKVIKAVKLTNSPIYLPEEPHVLKATWEEWKPEQPDGVLDSGFKIPNVRAIEMVMADKMPPILPFTDRDSVVPSVHFGSDPYISDAISGEAVKVVSETISAKPLTAGGDW